MNDFGLPFDTSKEVRKKHLEVLRNIGGEGRARLAFELSDMIRAATESGVRHRHPDYDEKTVRFAVLKLTLGRELFARLYPDINVKV